MSTPRARREDRGLGPARIASYREELITYGGRSILPDLVVWDGRLWYQKPNAAWPEILAYRLGRSWLNVAEAIPRANAVGATTLEGDPLPAGGAAPLIRIGQDCSPEELAVHDLDEAIAIELVFSLWIRRRDAHAWNRVYLAGVPLFFDSHIAFGVEPNHVPLDGFFEVGGDDGYAGRWRVRRLDKNGTPTTNGERALPQGTAAHRVRDPLAFDRHLGLAVQRIGEFGDSQLRAEALASGVPNALDVASLLSRTRDELHEGVERLRIVMNQA